MKIKLKDFISTRFAKIILPFIVAATGILIIRFYLVFLGDSESFIKILILMFAYFVPPLGKESIIPIGVSGGRISIPFVENSVFIPKIDPFLMAISIAFVDIVVALFLLWNYDLAKKIPLIGKFIEKVENIGKNSSNKYGWIKPLRFIGIILFVMVPFQGSGGVVGTIVGRLIGMKPVNTFLAISIGAVLGCILVAYFADVILSVFVTNFLLGLLILIILVVIGIMIYIYRKNHKK